MHPTLRATLFATVFLMAAGAASAQPFDGAFPFHMPPFDSSTAAFLPRFPREPITEAGRISAQGEAFFRGTTPVRLFGANIVADAAFPPRAQARLVAARMRKMGFNLVRFHHIDNGWTRNLFPDGSTRALDPAALDDLEFFVAQLKEEGIYVNMNLNVSRAFTAADGVASADSLLDFAKGVTLFDPQLIDLQKEYAQQLLTHVNPHTGRALAADPVLAMVEIANENSLYYLWRNGALRRFADGGGLMTRHAALLDTLWQNYLRARYLNTDALRAAWAAGASDPGTELIPDGGYETSVGNPWQLERHPGTEASVARDEAASDGLHAARVDVSQIAEEAWNIQWKRTGLSVQKGETYSVSFALRADAPRPISISAMLDVSPWTTFGGTTAAVTAEWQTFRFSFTAPQTTQGTLRLSFMVGGQIGSLWVDAVSMQTSGRIGLAADESLEGGSVHRIEQNDLLSYTDARARSMTAFYIELQDRYFAEMHRFLREDLGVTAPITGTNWNFGLVDLAVQSKMDYVDNHAYWDHPSFPGEPWSATDWRIANAPMVRATDGGTMARLMAGIPFAGKPYTISEYNHAFPNRFQTEGVLFLTAYSLFHGVDGLMFFDYNGSANWTQDRIDSFFSLHRNAAMMALMPSCAFAYRSGLVAPAATTLSVRYSQENVLGYPAIDTGSWEGTSLFPRTLALEHALVTETFGDPGGSNLSTLPPAPSPPFTTDTGEIVWDTDGLMKVAAPRFEAATGFFDAFRDTPLGSAVIGGGNGFGTFTWVSLSEQPLSETRRSLITLSTAAQNEGMRWDGMTTIHNNWGTGPVALRALRLSLSIAIAADSVRLYALDGAGSPTAQRTLFPGADGRFGVVLDQEVQPTVWFGLEAIGNGTAVGTERPQDRRFGFRPLFPNPARVSATAAFTLAAPGNVTLTLFDLLGRRVQRHAATGFPGENRVSIPLHTLAAGVYFCRLEAPEGTAVRPLRVE